MNAKPFRDPAIRPSGGDPYEELAPFGVSYDSSMAEIMRAGIEAQRRGELTPARRDAWACLRHPEKRLGIDFLYYQPDPAVFGTPGDPTVIPDEPPPPDPYRPPVEALTAEQLAQALGEIDAGPVPEPLTVASPPPIDADLWGLLQEAWEEREPPLAPLLPMQSFLEDEEEP